MTTKEINDIIKSGDLDKLKSVWEASKEAYFINAAIKSVEKTSNQDNDMKQYEPKGHDVHDKSIRQDKTIKKEDGTIDSVVKVTRLSVPEQKRIVLMAASFLGVPELVSSPAAGIETDMLAIVNMIFEDNKLDYKFRDILKRTMSERECAELWYTQEAEPEFWEGTAMKGAKFKLRMRVISPALGDSLYPVYDKFGDLVAFGRYYETTQQSDKGQDEKVLNFDIYTRDRFYFMHKIAAATEWSYNSDIDIPDKSYKGDGLPGIPNAIGKIPVIYYRQPATEWSDVQEIIDRFEKKISNHSDTNDYYDSPIVFAEGEIEGFANKGEQGKLLTGKNGAKVNYLTWDSAPESMKMEINNLVKFISIYTHTPDYSFDNVKGIGPVSGVALKLLFMDAHLKAADKEELFGQAVQRRINYLKAAIAIINATFKPAVRLKIKPKFEYFLPKDEAGEVATLVQAYQAGIISLKTAVKLNPLVSDADAELELINSEKETKPPTDPLANSGGGN